MYVFIAWISAALAAETTGPLATPDMQNEAAGKASKPNATTLSKVATDEDDESDDSMTVRE